MMQDMPQQDQIPAKSQPTAGIDTYEKPVLNLNQTASVQSMLHPGPEPVIHNDTLPIEEQAPMMDQINLSQTVPTSAIIEELEKKLPEDNPIMENSNQFTEQPQQTMAEISGTAEAPSPAATEANAEDIIGDILDYLNDHKQEIVHEAPTRRVAPISQLNTSMLQVPEDMHRK